MCRGGGTYARFVWAEMATKAMEYWTMSGGSDEMDARDGGGGARAWSADRGTQSVRMEKDRPGGADMARSPTCKPNLGCAPPPERESFFLSGSIRMSAVI